MNTSAIVRFIAHRGVRMWVVRAALLTLAIGGVAVAVPAWAQEVEVPIDVQIPLFLKVLAFDRQFRVRATNELVVMVAYQSGNRQSTSAKDNALRALAEQTLSAEGLAVRAVAVDLDQGGLRAALRQHKASMLYITPVRGVDIEEIASAAQAARVRTFSGVTTYITRGLAVGVRRIGDRPKLVVNLRAARLEGADFSAEFLKLVQVVD
jgi:hypothetical protein